MPPVYSLDEIFEKRLYPFIPFRIFVYENQFEEMEKDSEEKKPLLDDFREIRLRIRALTDSGEMSSDYASMILRNCWKVAKKLLAKYKNLREDVGITLNGK